MFYENVHWKKINGHERYKYQLIKDVMVYVGIFGYDIKTEWFHLRSDGVLVVFKGYAWDGSSGPTWDSLNTMLPSLAHDVGYQILREGLMLSPAAFGNDIDRYNVEFEKLRKRWDQVYYDKLIETKTWKIRAWWHYQGVRKFGRKSALPEFLK